VAILKLFKSNWPFQSAAGLPRWRCACFPFAVGGLLRKFLMLAMLFLTLPNIANSEFTNTDTTSGAGLYVDPTSGLGSWIWASTVSDNQTVFLWKAFDVPSSPRLWRARLVMTVDNEFTVYLDGRELGHGAEWRELFVFDLTPLLTPGRHVLAVKAFNSYSFAGMLLGLQINFGDGNYVQIKSDQSWKIVPEGLKNWQKITEAKPDWDPATVEAPEGGSPWWIKPENINIMPTVLPVTVRFWQTGWFQALLSALCLAGITTSLWLTARLALHRKEHWLLQRERVRIARDIHDDLGPKITQLVLHGELLQREPAGGQRISSEIDMICHDARDVLSAFDEILWAVNPKRDGLQDFITYACNYAEKFLKVSSIQCFLDVEPNLPASGLNLPLRRGLFMVAKEALNNVVKHSGATELKLRIHCDRGRLILVLEDNGRGFDPTKTNQQRNGLNNMTERMAELGGAFLIVSQPGKGCRIEISVPLKYSRWRSRAD
jgi:signal transduction histidine kinase